MKLFLTFLICLGIVLSSSACQKNPTGDPDPYQTGYDSGYQEGYTNGQENDNEQEPQENEPDETPKQNAPGYGRTNPAPIGTEQTITDEFLGYTASVTVNSVTRGEEAWNMVSEANQFNDAPPENSEYVVVNVTVTALDSSSEAALSVNGYSDFSAFSATNAEYDLPLIVDPEPALSGDIYEGGSLTGNITFLVSKDDDGPKIVYLRKYDGSGGIWFSLAE